MGFKNQRLHVLLKEINKPYLPLRFRVFIQQQFFDVDVRKIYRISYKRC
jgi:hypothetical protein